MQFRSVLAPIILVIRHIKLPVLIIIFPILFRDLADDPAGIARGDHIGRNILCDHASGADHRIIANGDTWQNNGVTANPDIISYGNGIPYSYPEFSAVPPASAGLIHKQEPCRPPSPPPEQIYP